MLGCLLKSLTAIQLVCNYSSQNNYSIAVRLSQAEFVKGGEPMYIFRTSITLKDGTKIYAKDYGKKAFRIWIGPDPEPVKKN